MQQVQVDYNHWSPTDRNQRVGQHPNALVVSDECVVATGAGDPVAAVVKLRKGAAEDAALLGAVLQRGIPWNDAGKANRGSARTSGIRYPNQTFGTTAPQPMRRRYGCRYATFHQQRPDVVALLAKVFTAGWEAFQETLPETAGQTWERTTHSVHEDWLFGETPWTSGIINDVVSLPYHRDSGNIPGTWSAMVVLRKQSDGGMLHLPEYGVAFECPDLSMLFFDGQATWHGVTPIRLRNAMSYRRTVVMYSKAKCRECGPVALEAQRAAAVATLHDVPHASVFKKATK